MLKRANLSIKRIEAVRRKFSPHIGYTIAAATKVLENSTRKPWRSHGVGCSTYHMDLRQTPSRQGFLQEYMQLPRTAALKFMLSCGYPIRTSSGIDFLHLHRFCPFFLNCTGFRIRIVPDPAHSVEFGYFCTLLGVRDSVKPGASHRPIVGRYFSGGDRFPPEPKERLLGYGWHGRMIRRSLTRRGAINLHG